MTEEKTPITTVPTEPTCGPISIKEDRAEHLNDVESRPVHYNAADGSGEEEPQPDDSNIVDWDGDDDPSNPMNWSAARKWSIIALVSVTTFNTSMATTIFAPGVQQAQDEFGDHNSAEGSLLLSIFVIGLAVGPLVLAPSSELYGRAIAYHSANVVFLIASILCAVAVNVPMLLVFRLIMGLACSVPVTLGGGVIADLIVKEKRGAALNFWNVGPILGPVLAPVIGGYLSLKAGWRWTYWLVAILSGVLTIASFIFFRETYAPCLLERKARWLRDETGRADLRSKYDKGQTPGILFRTALIRPAKFIVRSPIVLILSLFVTLVYSYMWILFTSFTSVFTGQYGFNIGEVGLTYFGLGCGYIVGVISLILFSDRWLKHREVKVGRSIPEDRLPPLVVGAFVLPIGLFWYGWTVEYRVHWMAPIVGLAFCGLGIMYVFNPVMMYLIDAYPLYASSAIAASTVVRSVFGACIPLAGPSLYERLGLGWGNSLLGFLALAFAPSSLVLLVYGERIRKDLRFQPHL